MQNEIMILFWWLLFGGSLLLFSAWRGLIDIVADWFNVYYAPAFLFLVFLVLLALIALHLTVRPPWWRTTWAYATYVFLILILGLTFEFRHRRNLAAETRYARRLEQEVQARTQELAGGEEMAQVRAGERAAWESDLLFSDL